MQGALQLWQEESTEPNAPETREYTESHCWQYDIRLRNRVDDLLDAGMTEEYAATLRVSDFEFRQVTSTEDKQDLTRFIHRHEWLGNLSQYTTHWYGAYHGKILAGALLFNMPNAFSKLLGEDTPNLERLISRGACVSWSPKNLASAFIMSSIKDMAQTTQYRLFTAYSDPMAKELGTIYQACNFYYLGQTSGAATRHINPYTGKYVSDRFFRSRSAYKRYAKELGIRWRPDWCHATGMAWDNIPDDIEQQLRDQSKVKHAESESIPVPPKHKYAMLCGANKKETAQLRARFSEINKTYEYPKDRGGVA